MHTAILKKCLFPVQRVANILANRAATDFFSLQIFFKMFVRKKCTIMKKNWSQSAQIYSSGCSTGNIYFRAGLTTRPPLDKKLFPVHRPGGLKRADWNFFSIFSKKFFFFYFSPLYILVYKK